MKKNVLKTFSLLLVILILLITVSCGADDVNDIFQNSFFSMEYAFSPERCQGVFGCTPKEFFDLELDIYKDVEDFRADARISSEGYLILLLSKPQRDALINSDLFDCFSDNPNVEASCENRSGSVIVNGYAETAYEDAKDSLIIAEKVYAYLLLKYELEKKVTLNYVIRDGVTGEVFYSTVWEAGTIYIPIHEYNFSPLPK